MYAKVELNEFRKVANGEKFTMLGGKLELFQTITTRSLKFFRVWIRRRLVS